MEEQDLGERAIGFLAEAIQSGRALDVAGRELRRLVGDRLRTSQFGTQALERFEERPRDRHRAAAASSVVNEEAGKDPGFAEDLKNAVQQVHLSQGQAGGSISGQQISTATGAGAISSNIHSARDVKLVGARSKKTWLTIGFAAVAVVSITVGGAVAYNYYGEGAGDKSSGSATSDGVGGGMPIADRNVASIGAAPGKAGVRDTWDAVNSAFKEHDYARICALYTPEAQQTLEQANGACESYMARLDQSSDSDGMAINGHKALLENVQVKGTKALLTLAGEGQPDGVGYASMDRFGDRWRVSAKDYRAEFLSQ
ncbi:hypothetical protein ACH40E_39595 [Streptomyces acidicola]|uniref:hypothetical protein n=1 Tax=Streptomyces acidicola TaxID=2596892 RepID=UPI00379E60C2